MCSLATIQNYFIGLLRGSQEYEATAYVVGDWPSEFLEACERRLQGFAKMYRLPMRLAVPCRTWWGEDLAQFARQVPFAYTSGLAAWHISRSPDLEKVVLTNL